jgi:hypothetical protein
MNVIGLVLGLTLVFAAVAIVLILKLSRAREVQLAAEQIAKLGWPQVAANDAGWEAFVQLASTRSTGAERKLDGLVDEQQESVPGQGYRDPAARHPRFLTIGTRTLRSKTRHQRHHSETHELWIGEARAMPVDTASTACEAVLKSRPAIVRNLVPVVHVSPQAWVMVSPVARGGKHFSLIVEVAKELSQAFDAA